MPDSPPCSLRMLRPLPTTRWRPPSLTTRTHLLRPTSTRTSPRPTTNSSRRVSPRSGTSLSASIRRSRPSMSTLRTTRLRTTRTRRSRWTLRLRRRLIPPPPATRTPPLPTKQDLRRLRRGRLLLSRRARLLRRRPRDRRLRARTRRNGVSLRQKAFRRRPSYRRRFNRLRSRRQPSLPLARSSRRLRKTSRTLTCRWFRRLPSRACRTCVTRYLRLHH